MHIRGRGQQGRQDGDHQYRIPPVFFKYFSGHPDPGAENHEDRQFENEAKGQDEQGHKIDKTVHGDHRLEFGGLKAEQKADPVGQGHQEAEERAGIKQDRGGQHKPEQLAAGQAEGQADALPDHVHDPGHEDDTVRRKRKF